MGKNIDLVQILMIVIAGMFIPFFMSLIINYGLDLSNIEGLIKIFSSFGVFLIIFGIELIIVYFYFFITNLLANKKMNYQKEK